MLTKCFRQNVVCIGNYNVLFDSGDPRAERLVNLFSSCGMIKKVAEYTRGKYCLNNIFTNLEEGRLSLCIFD